MIVPMATAIPEATMPTRSEVRAPYIVRTKRSRPAPSAPNQKCEFGPLGDPEVVGHRVVGLVLRVPVIRSAIWPPKRARKISRMITTPPAKAALSCLNRIQKSCRGLLPTTATPSREPRRQCSRRNWWAMLRARHERV